jgi:hypothetical protein
MGEAVLLEHCPHPSEQQSQSAERRFVQKKCEKSRLKHSQVKLHPLLVSALMENYALNLEQFMLRQMGFS